MSPAKRKIPSKVAKMQARKKARLSEPAPDSAPSTSRTEGKSIRADELAWKEVELPEGMDDLEGFYGLEEIDGVDIIKDSNGTLRFAAADGVEASTKTRKRGRNVGDDRPDPFPAFVEGAEADDVSKLNVDAGSSESAVEWNGFSDSDDEQLAQDAQASDDESEDPEGGDADAETEKLRKLLKQMTDGHNDDDNDDDDEDWPEEEESDGPEMEEFDQDGNLVTSSGDQEAESDLKSDREPPPSKSATGDPDDILGNGGSFSALQEHLNDEDEDGTTDVSAWQTLGLLPATLSGLAKMAFAKPTDIQRAAIPRINQGQDVIGKAPTGSGKTLAYAIPIFERWFEMQVNDGPSAKETEKLHTALVIAPTRELAKQIEEHITSLVKNSTEQPPRIATLTGGLSIQKQKRLLNVADIVIATPGRLWEVITEVKGVLAPLQAIQFLVLDEADRLLSTGHFQEMSQILAALDRTEHSGTDSGPRDSDAPKIRQTLIFSATFAQSLSKSLAINKRTNSFQGDDEMSYLLRKVNFRSTQPAFIDVNPEAAMAPTLREALLQLPAGTQKDLYLYALLLYRSSSRILVFVNSINAARRIVPFLTNLGVDAQPLHSQMVQKARLGAIEKFSADVSSKKKKAGAAGSVWKGNVLVATDVAARGLDIPAVDIVLHYHVPRAADTYVHRSGRTARAENEGSSVLICAPEEAAGVRRLVAKVHASHAASGKRKIKGLEPLHVDRQLISRLRPRAVLAKEIADAEMAKEKSRAQDRAVAEAANDLGIEYGSDGELEMELEGAKKMDGKSGRGKKRKEMEKEARGMSKAEMKSRRAELRALLGQRVNTGVSARYLTSGGVDMEKLLAERESGGGVFLGELPDLGFRL